MLTSIHRQAHVFSVSEIIQRLYDYYSSEKSYSPHINEKLSFIRNLIEMAEDFDKGYLVDTMRGSPYTGRVD